MKLLLATFHGSWQEPAGTFKRDGIAVAMICKMTALRRLSKIEGQGLAVAAASLANKTHTQTDRSFTVVKWL